jgi:transposase
MSEKRRKFAPEFREGAVRVVREAGKPIAQVARDMDEVFATVTVPSVSTNSCRSTIIDT